LPVLEALKNGYKIWHEYHQKLPKTQRYSLGNKIDKLFIEIIEMAACAGFVQPREKEIYLKVAIRKLDTLKIIILILYESGSLTDKKYLSLSEPLDEAGRMLGGWYGKNTKENSSGNIPKEK